jgi:hypothetical protein
VCSKKVGGTKCETLKGISMALLNRRLTISDLLDVVLSVFYEPSAVGATG